MSNRHPIPWLARIFPIGRSTIGEDVQKTVEKRVHNRPRNADAGLRLALRPRQILNYCHKMFNAG